MKKLVVLAMTISLDAKPKKESRTTPSLEKRDRDDYKTLNGSVEIHAKDAGEIENITDY